jgi:type I restriction enzyme, S subunit
MDLLKEHFDLAIGTPDGITRLRELILKLGMQGKLVPQSDTDTSAKILLQEIAEEKQRLLKRKGIKSQKSLPEIKPSEIPYQIPLNWEWIKLEEICTLITDGAHHTPNYIGEGIPFLSVKNLSSGKIDFNECKYISRIEHLELIKRCHPERNDILLTKIGTTGIAVSIDTDEEFSIFVSVALLKLVKDKVYPKFIEYLINSPLVKKYSKDGTEGVGNKNLVLRKIREFIVPFPPLDEQKRIVEKIDELMRLCDLLEKQRDSKNDLLSKINSSAINKLLQAENEFSLTEAWEFIQNQFELIFADKKNVFDLKEVILNLAMRGKLSTSDINDTPASILITTIEEERKSLIKQKIISKQKELPKIGITEKKYNLPLGWEWVRLNEYGTWKSGSTPSRTNQSFYGGDIPWVKSGEVKQGRIKETSETITELAIEKCSLHRNPIGSVLIAMYGANIGEVGVLEIEAATNQAVCACKTYSPIYNKFLYYLLLSLRTNFISQGAGAAQPNISREKIINTVVPLPPFDEQKRIVEKIEKLFRIADLFESNIEESSKKQVQILNSVLAKI